MTRRAPQVCAGRAEPAFPPNRPGVLVLRVRPVQYLPLMARCVFFVPQTLQYHLFDGDGMVFGVRIKNGQASFSNAWVRTERFRIEEQAQAACMPKLGDMHGVAGLALLALSSAKSCACRTPRLRLHLAYANPHARRRRRLGGPGATASAMGTANTALEFHAGRFLALNEGDVPWALRALCDGALETIGACTFDGSVASRTFTAHPKRDALRDEMCWFGYAIDSAPHLTYGVLDAQGKAVHTTAVPLRFPQMIHDFAITERYAVFWDLPLAFEPKVMVTEDRLPFMYDKPRGARFGLLARRAEGSSARWFALPGCMIFHSLAAWEEEEGNRVRLFACRIEDFDLRLPPAGKSHDPRTVDGGSPTLFEFTFDLRTGEATQSCVVPLPAGCTGMDFPRAHPALTGYRCHFGYLSMFEGLLITGVAKVDLHTRAIVGRIDYPAGMCGGEAFFVPRHDGAPPTPADEDDGWLLSYVSTETASTLWVMDAKTMAASPVAVLDLPTRMPWGFHSTFVSQAALASQPPAAAA
jgi:carotenoid cleavage dioxygenase-like enzyme